MVGFVYDPTTKAKEGEEEPRQPSVLKKQIDTIDFSLTELDDLSSCFDDSLFDFDSIKDWIEEDPETYMADLNLDPGMVDSLKVEFGIVDSKEAIVDGSRELGSFGSLIEEEMGKVSLEGGLDGSTIKFQENKCEAMGVESNEVGSFDKSGEVATVKCLDGNNCGMMAVVGDDLKSNEVVCVNESCEEKTVKCEDENQREIMGVSGDGVKSNEVAGLNGSDVKNIDVLAVGENGAKSVGMVDDGDDESESEAESESLSSSSGSSSSSSSSDDDEEEDEEEEEEENGVEEEKGDVKRETDMEEGEIRDACADEMVAWSDEEDEVGGVKAGPIMSKNELQVLPPVPPVNVTLEPHHQTSPVGVVLSIVGAQVIVEGVEKHNPLNEGSILWITEIRSPLGLVDEIFGPVKNPYYIVRYNSDSEVPAGIQEGTLISFVPEFVNHVLNNSNLYKKGYDASGENDEELSDELEFSDDEKEAEYRRKKKQMAKRELNDQNVGNRKGDKKKFKNKGGKWKNDQPSPTQPPAGAGQLPREQNQHAVTPVTASLDHGNFSRSSGPVQGFSGGPGTVPTYPQLEQGPGFSAPSSGVWMTGIPCQQPQLPQQNQHFPPPVTSSGPFQGFAGGPMMYPQLAQAPGFSSPSSGVWINGVPYQQPPSNSFPNGFPPNVMPWPQQNQPWQPYGPMPSPSGVPFQQQFNANPGLPSNVVLQGGQSNFGAGPVFTAWHPNQNGFNQSQAAMGLQGQRGTTSTNVGENGMPSNGLQPPGASPGHTGASQNFTQGADFGRGRRAFRGGGGRFGRGRGRQQSK